MIHISIPDFIFGLVIFCTIFRWIYIILYNRRYDSKIKMKYLISLLGIISIIIGISLPLVTYYMWKYYFNLPNDIVLELLGIMTVFTTSFIVIIFGMSLVDKGAI